MNSYISTVSISDSIAENKSVSGWRLWSCGQNIAKQLGLGHTIDRSKFQSVNVGVNFVGLASGAMISFAIDTLGRLWSWGNNEDYSLGRECEDDDADPDMINGNGLLDGKKVVDISCGNSFVAAVNSTGNLYCWGSFRDEKSGKKFVFSKKPKLVRLPGVRGKVIKVHMIVAGHEHLLILDSLGRVFGLGLNNNGQLALPKGTHIVKNVIDITRSILTCIPTTHSGLTKSIRISNIFAGGDCSWCELESVSGKGKIYDVVGWGSNSFYQLGTGHIKSLSSSSTVKESIILPTKLQDMKGKRVKDIHSGSESSLFLMESGELLTCGRCDFGSVGTLDACLNVWKFDKKDIVYQRRLKKLEYFVEHDIKAVSYYCRKEKVILNSSKSVEVQKQSSSNKSLIPRLIRASSSKASLAMSSKSSIKPVKYPFVKRLKHKFKHISMESRSCFAITEGGELFVWGDSYHGQLGLDGGKFQKNPENRPEEAMIPVRLSFKRDNNCEAVSCGWGHCLLLANLK